MKVEYINPFIESVYELFTTMLSAQAKRGDLGLVKGDGRPKEIMAIIGMNGEARGTVALSFPTETALGMVNRMLSTEIKTVDETISDGVAELVNIVAGSAKAKFAGLIETPITLSLPTVVRGTSFSVNYPSSAMWLEVPFTSDLGPFSLRVTFELQKTKGGSQ